MDLEALNKAGLNHLLKAGTKEMPLLAWDIAVALNTLKIISKKKSDDFDNFEAGQLEKCIEIFTHLYIDFLNENGENVFDN